MVVGDLGILQAARVEAIALECGDFIVIKHESLDVFGPERVEVVGEGVAAERDVLAVEHIGCRVALYAGGGFGRRAFAQVALCMSRERGVEELDVVRVLDPQVIFPELPTRHMRRVEIQPVECQVFCILKRDRMKDRISAASGLNENR